VIQVLKAGKRHTAQEGDCFHFFSGNQPCYHLLSPAGANEMTIAITGSLTLVDTDGGGLQVAALGPADTKAPMAQERAPTT